MPNKITGPEGWDLGDGLGDVDAHFFLRLFVSGASPASSRAIVNIKSLCEEHLPRRYSLDIIDVRQQQDLTEEEQIVALPMLLKTAPLPVRRLIGDMSDKARVLRALGIEG